VRSDQRVRCWFGGCIVLAAALGPRSVAQERPVDLTEVQIEDLINIPVTSVSKHEQTLAHTAAAVFVITQEDIRRSGALNLPDVLRMAPGVDVQQIDANAWAISVRGFNSRYSNKVLVLIDGRSVYTPSFSGVFWEQIDMPLVNIERIEVIRGPGATVWGANAVNGVISIITKSAKDTQGGLVSVATGSLLEQQGLVQYGGGAGSSAGYRAFVSTYGVRNSAGASFPGNDHWSRYHAGSRVDWNPSNRDSVMVQGDAFDIEANQTRRSSYIPTPYDTIIREDVDATGGDFLARWNHTNSGGSETSLQTYFDAYNRSDLGTPEKERVFDLDFQHHWKAGGRHEIVWGLGYRLYDSSLAPGYSVSFSPPARRDSLYSAFFQDDIRVAESVQLTIGSKFEHNPYTGFQMEPGLRLLWNPSGTRHALWASASRALRQPSRADTAIRTDLQEVPAGPNMLQVLRLYGDPRIRNEEARDYEAGYRAELARNFTLDVTTFLTSYRHVETIEPQAARVLPGSPVLIEIPMVYSNQARALDYGAEWTVNWRVTPHWRISQSYSYLHAAVRQEPGSQGIGTCTVAQCFPQQLIQFRSMANLPGKLEFDQSFYYTARLPGSSIPGNPRVDLRVGRRLSQSGEISLVGQNLLRPRTLEYGDAYSVIATQSVRSIYLGVTWRF